MYEQSNKWASQHSASFSHVLLALVGLYFARINGLNDLVIGVPTLNRVSAQQRLTIGMFASVVPLSISIDEKQTFGELVHAIAKDLQECYKHQQLSMTDIHQISRVKQSDQRRLYDITLSFENINIDHSVDNINYEAHVIAPSQQELPLLIHVRDYHESADVAITFAFLSYINDNGVIDNIHSRLASMLTLCLKEENQCLGDIPIVDEAERRLVVETWNDTATSYPDDVCIHQLFEDQVARRPEAVALVYKDNKLTYDELNTHANRLAHYLIKEGVGPDKLVALCVERSFDMVIGLMAVLKAGGAYVPMDPAYPADRLRFMLDDSQPVLLLTDGSADEALGKTAKDFKLVNLNDHKRRWDKLPDTNPSVPELTPINLAYVIYTSGSTGLPKGVMGPHRATVNRITAQKDITPFLNHDVCCQKTSIGFVDAIFETLGPLSHGLPIVVISRRDGQDPKRLIARLTENSVTRIITVPSLAKSLLDTAEKGQLSTLTSWTLSGEALETPLLNQLREALPDCSITNLYGSSEVTADATACQLPNINPLAGIPISIGRPIANTKVYILDSHGSPVPIGVTGELHIGGAGVARGYLNQPELTAERFITDPFSDSPDARLYKTGDLGRWLPDGTI